jgi:hypothetical protein
MSRVQQDMIGLQQLQAGQWQVVMGRGVCTTGVSAAAAAPACMPAAGQMSFWNGVCTQSTD